MSERERRVESLFQRALELAPAERAALLGRECAADDELRRRVQDLLDQDERGTSPQLEGDALRGPPPPVERIGPYRLVRVLGEGGMGTVHLAEQEEPVRRLVALKTIRLGRLSPAAVARFELERQALAALDHPGIAKIFDGGTTPSGLPYLVMEYAPGLALDDHCDRYSLDLRTRLELFARVCDAVRHAHQKGIVHRDLTPGNVLVDGGERPSRFKIVDFGIARAMAGPLATGAGDPPPLAERAGTPAYMSPERLSARDSVPDTRDDVYSLGVMLHLLLCGGYPSRPPGSSSTHAPPSRAIASAVEPLAPSVRLAAEADLQEIARARGTTPARLVRALDRELDALVLRALAADPARRYGGAGELGADIRRYLSGQPLEAMPARTSYRVRKFVLRHRVGVAAVVALLVTVILGLAGTLRGLRVARAGWDEAEKRAAAEHGERAELDLLVRAFKEALLLAQGSQAAGTKLTVEELLDVLGTHVDDLGRSDPGSEAALRSVLARCLLLIGADEEAHVQYLRAYAAGEGALHDDPLDRFDVLEGLIESMRRQGDMTGARKLVIQAMEVARQVFAGRDRRFHEAIEPLLQLAAGARIEGRTALEALRVILAEMPDAVVRGDESGVMARILIEAAVRLFRQDSPEAEEFVTALEQRAAEVLTLPEVRRVTFQWTLVHVRLVPDRRASDETLAAARKLAELAAARLPIGQWLRSDSHRLVAAVHLSRGELEACGDELELTLSTLRDSQPYRARRWQVLAGACSELAAAWERAGDEARAREWSLRSGDVGAESESLEARAAPR